MKYSGLPLLPAPTLFPARDCTIPTEEECVNDGDSVNEQGNGVPFGNYPIEDGKGGRGPGSKIFPESTRGRWICILLLVLVAVVAIVGIVLVKTGGPPTPVPVPNVAPAVGGGKGGSSASRSASASPSMPTPLMPSSPLSVFKTREELSGAVAWYLAGDNKINTLAAHSYGWPIAGIWDVSKIEDFSRLFAAYENNDAPQFKPAAAKFNDDISGWDLSSATDISYMFYYAMSFNQPLADWNVSRFNRHFLHVQRSSVF
jgi:hypothetical protein